MSNTSDAIPVVDDTLSDIVDDKQYVSESLSKRSDSPTFYVAPDLI